MTLQKILLDAKLIGAWPVNAERSETSGVGEGMLEFVLQAVRVIISIVRSRLRASRDLVSKARTVSGIDICMGSFTQ